MAASASEPLSWPEEQRAFLQDGPGWLLTEAERESLLASDERGRESFIDDFFATDPLPATAGNELVDGVALRQRLVESEFLTYLDDRARLLFLHMSRWFRWEKSFFGARGLTSGRGKCSQPDCGSGEDRTILIETNPR